MASGWRSGGEKVATYPRTHVTHETIRTIGTTARSGAPIPRKREPGELNGGDAAILWATYSRYPAEAGIAGRRFKALAPTYVDPWALLMALCEAAFEGHHAAGSLNGPFLRSRAARIREGMHEQRKREDREQEVVHRDTPLRRLDTTAFMRGIA